MKRRDENCGLRTGAVLSVILAGSILILTCVRADTPAPWQQVQRELSDIYDGRYSEVRWKSPETSLESIEVKREFVQPAEYTFTEQIAFVGEAEAGTNLVLCVYTVDDQNNAAIWYHAETLVGPSGVFQENVPLPRIGRQFLMVLTDYGGQGEGVCYEFYRNSEDVCRQLLDYTLNIYKRLK